MTLVSAEFEQALRDRGAPIRCCEHWPECSHMLAWYEKHERPNLPPHVEKAIAAQEEALTAHVRDISGRDDLVVEFNRHEVWCASVGWFGEDSRACDCGLPRKKR